jgi:hypothetical protein
MATCSPLGFEQHDVAMRVEAMRRGEPGNPAADDGDPHLRRSPPQRPQLLPTE